MSLTLTKPPQFSIADEGVHLATLVSIIDLGIQTQQKYKKPEETVDVHKVLFSFKIRSDEDDPSNNSVIHKQFTATLSDQSSLKPVCQALFGGVKENEWLSETFNLTDLIGKSCQISVIHTENKGITYANISNCTALARNMKADPLPENDFVIYEIEDGENDVFLNFSEKMQDKIRKAKNFPIQENEESDSDYPDFEPDSDEAF